MGRGKESDLRRRNPATNPATNLHTIDTPLSKPIVELSEEEQLRLINETGLLQKIHADEQQHPTGRGRSGAKTKALQAQGPFEDKLFLAVLLAIPLTTLYGFLDYVVHMQYGFTEQFTLWRVLRREVPLFPALVAASYGLYRLPQLHIIQLLYAAASIACGCLVIDLSADHPTFGAMLKTPGLTVLWILLVVHMRLGYAVAALGITSMYYYWPQLVGFKGDIRSSFDSYT